MGNTGKPILHSGVQIILEIFTPLLCKHCKVYIILHSMLMLYIMLCVVLQQFIQ